MISDSAEAPIVLRTATLADAEPVWFCRQSLLDGAAIRTAATKETFEAHVAWFQRATSDPQRLFLIIEKDQAWLGYVRFDPMDCCSGHRVSIALVCDARGTGIGGAALRLGCSRAERAGFKPLYADIGINNDASRRIFQNCGFALLSEDVSSDGFQRLICRP